MSIETARAFSYLATTIAADATLAAIPGFGGFWEGAADLGTSEPWIVANIIPGVPDTVNTRGGRLFVRTDIAIEAVGTFGNYAKVLAAADRLDAMLQLVRGVAVGGVTIYTIWRKSSIHRHTTEKDGTRYTHVGALWRFELQ